MPRVGGPGAGRQGARLGPQFRALDEAFAARRATLVQEGVTEVDPALVLVFDLAGSVEAFGNAVNKVPGLEFLTELLEDATDADDDFRLIDTDGNPKEGAAVGRSLYLVMSDAEAAQQLVRLFRLWLKNPSMTFERGLARFRAVFEHLRAIRPWGAEDRVRETGLLDAWRESVQVAGQSVSPVLTEVELWYRTAASARAAAEAHTRAVVQSSKGRILSRAEIPAIGYHALLVELPIQQVQRVLEAGANAIGLLTTDDVMLVSPFIPMSVAPLSDEEPAAPVQAPVTRPDGLPRVALLDGLPMANHVQLAGRLVLDDPDGFATDYPVSSRRHGTAMASLIVHGDLSAGEEALSRALYVRPIMQPHEFVAGIEQTPPNELLVDLLHRAITRIARGDGDAEPAAPSVRVVNLSIGAPSRALVRRMSPLGRLLDWLAYELNLLFIVSAGNHVGEVPVPVDAIENLEEVRGAAARFAHANSRLRGILPPGDSLNALTVGALHSDSADEPPLADTVLDITGRDMPALYSAVGPGVGRSIKPEVLHTGGRALYARPAPAPGHAIVTLRPAPTSATGPGIRVASPGRMGATDATAFEHGTSVATALVTREASRLFDLLEGPPGDDATALADPEFHPVIVKALLVHATSWGDRRAPLQQALALDGRDARRRLTTALGYGGFDGARAGTGAPNRAVVVAGGRIGGDGRHTYELPLPASLASRAVWHRFTITLAYFAPTAPTLSRYRSAKVFFEHPDERVMAARRVEAEARAVRRGTCQHEVLEGDRAMAFAEGSALPIHVECMDDARHLLKGQWIRYGLVASVEAHATTSITIHDEVRAALRERARTRARQRLAGA